MIRHNRRWILKGAFSSLSLALSPWLWPSPGFAASPHHKAVVNGLTSFLDKAFIPPHMRCSTRRGDGVLAFADVKIFMARFKFYDAKEMQVLEIDLRKESREDHANNRIIIIDGWVLSRTEALAASAQVLLLKKNCRLPVKSVQ